MSHTDSPSPQDAFDRAARQSLRGSPLPAPPAWLDAQIQSAAHAQAQRYAAESKPRTTAWWQAPWLKVALPTVAVATLLLAVWLPQTQVTEQAVFLPDAARVEQAAPSAAAPAANDQAALPTPNVNAAQDLAGGATAAATRPPPEPIATPAEPAKPLIKAAPALDTKAEAKTVKPPLPKQQAEPERQRNPTQAAAPTVASTPAPASASVPAPTTPPPAAPAMASATSSLPPQTDSAREMNSAPAVAADRAAPSPAGNRPLMARTGEARSAAAAPAMGYSSAARASAQSPAALPHHEFETIRQMLREGKRDDAAKRLNTLLERQPGLEVPEDLRPLLIKP